MISKNDRLLFDCHDDYINSSSISHILNSKETHFNVSDINLIINLKKKINTTFYAYVYDKDSYEKCLSYNIKPHICFYGMGIFNSELLSYIHLNHQIYLFPDEELIKYNINLLSQHLSLLNRPILLSFSNIFNKLIVFEEHELWLIQLYNLIYNRPEALIKNISEKSIYMEQSLNNIKFKNIDFNKFDFQ